MRGIGYGGLLNRLRAGGRDVKLVACLAVFAAAMSLGGFTRLFQSLYDPSPPTLWVVGSAAVVALAAGAVLPHRVAGALTVRSRRRRGARAGYLDTLAAAAGEDRGAWSLLAVTVVTFLVAQLVSSLLWGPVSDLYRWSLARFLWNAVSLPAWEWLLALLVLGLPWCSLGAVLACLYAIACRTRGSRAMDQVVDAGLTGPVLLGGAPGLLAAEALLGCGFDPFVPVLLGVAGAAGASLLVIRWMAGSGTLVRRRADASVAMLDLAAEPTRLGKLTIMVLGVTWGAGALIWLRLAGLTVLSHPPRPLVALAVMAAGTGMGVVAATRYHGWRQRAQRALGLACGTWAAAQLCGIAGWAVLFASQGDGTALALPTWVRGLVGFVCLCGPSVIFGAALTMGKHVIVMNTVSQPVAFGQMLGTFAVGAAAGWFSAGMWGLPGLGSLLTLCVGLLFQVGLGTLLVIYDVHLDSRGRNIAVAGGCMLLLVTCFVVMRCREHWIYPSRAGSDQIREGRWLTATAGPRAAPSPRVGGGHMLLDGGRVEVPNTGYAARQALVCRLSPSGGRVLWLAAQSPRLGVDSWAGQFAAVDMFLLDPSLGGGRDGRRGRLRLSALQALRSLHSQYDAVVVESLPSWHGAWATTWSLEALTAMRNRAGPRGVVVQFLPRAGLTLQQFGTICRTFELVFDSRAWLLVGPVEVVGGAGAFVAVRDGPPDAGSPAVAVALRELRFAERSGAPESWRRPILARLSSYDKYVTLQEWSAQLRRVAAGEPFDLARRGEGPAFETGR